MDKHLFKKIALAALALAGVVFAVVFFVNKTYIRDYAMTLSNLPSVLPYSTPFVTPTSGIETATQISPDGKVTLTMTKTLNGGLSNYTFSSSGITMATRTGLTSDSYQIPFNTWAPDDKSFFVKENNNGQLSYFAYPTGDNVADIFKQKFPNYVLTDITGWAAPTLLILNTNNADGTVGPSYWFDTASKGFTLLSTRFN